MGKVSGIPGLLMAHQCTQQIHCLQYELLMPNPRDSQVLEFLVGDAQKLVPGDFLPLEVLNVLLQAVIKP